MLRITSCNGETYQSSIFAKKSVWLLARDSKKSAHFLIAFLEASLAGRGCSVETRPSYAMVDILLGTQHVGIRGLKGLENHGRNVLPTVLVKPKKVCSFRSLGLMLKALDNLSSMHHLGDIEGRHGCDRPR